MGHPILVCGWPCYTDLKTEKKYIWRRTTFIVIGCKGPITWAGLDRVARMTRFAEMSFSEKLPSFSSKRGHVEKKHVLIRNQTWHVWPPSIWSLTAVKLAFLRAWSGFNAKICINIPKRSTCFLMCRLIFPNMEGLLRFLDSRHFSETCSNSLQTSKVWRPYMLPLHAIRACFSVMCPCLDENDGTRGKPASYSLRGCLHGGRKILALGRS